MDFHGAYVEVQADVSAVKLINGFTLENATFLTGEVEDYEGPAITYEGEHSSTYPTTVRDVVVRGSATNKTGVGVALVADSDGPTRKVTHTYFKGVHIHNYAVGLLFRDVHTESNLDYLNANYYQGRISGSLRAIELEHANGNDITVDFQPSPDTLSALRCFACGHNRISGMFWDSQQVAEKVLQFDADSLRNHIETSLHPSYIQNDGTDNVIH